jgi:hypothetical protein
LNSQTIKDGIEARVAVVGIISELASLKRLVVAIKFRITPEA